MRTLSTLARSSRSGRSAAILIAIFVLIVAVVLISMNMGSFPMTPLDVIRTVFGFGTDRHELVLFQFRMPRIVVCLLIGAGLALSGCILQGITRNPLADPGILGINAGAGLVVIMFVLFYPSTAAAPVITSRAITARCAGVPRDRGHPADSAATISPPCAVTGAATPATSANRSPWTEV